VPLDLPGVQALADASNGLSPPVAAADRAPAWPSHDAAPREPVAADSMPTPSWEDGLEQEAVVLLASGRHDVWDALTQRFESRLIRTALASTKGRRIEAAQKLGIGRNTITRKIQELGLE
jgi:two-component system nitrogen regulation response regulator GlnG